MDVAHIEKAEASLNNLIERRARAASKAEAEEDLRRASERRHKAAKRERNRWEWIRFFDKMAANHAALAESYKARAEQLIDHHEAQAARLCQEGTR